MVLATKWLLLQTLHHLQLYEGMGFNKATVQLSIIFDVRTLKKPKHETV